MKSRRTYDTSAPAAQEILRVARGLSAWTLARIAGTASPGIDWRRCNKGHIASVWARDTYRNLDPNKLVRAILEYRAKEGLDAPASTPDTAWSEKTRHAAVKLALRRATAWRDADKQAEQLITTLEQQGLYIANRKEES